MSELRIVMFCEFLIVMHSPVVELMRTFSMTVPFFPSITIGPDGASELAGCDGVGVADVVLDAVGEAVFVAVGEAVVDAVIEGVGVAVAPRLATVRVPRRLVVVPSDQLSTALMVCDPSASFVVS
jgi:DNA-binding transcriptional LysR family regulator